MAIIRYEGELGKDCTLSNILKQYDYIAYIDGGCFPKNPGGTAVSKFILFDHTGSTLQKKHSESNILGSGSAFSNNVAEWGALIALLDYIKGNMFFSTSPNNQLSILVKSDSMMLVQQVLGEFKIKTGLYKESALLGIEKWEELKSKFRLDIVHIPREENLAHGVK
jgi:ribonuclease HI